MKHHILELADKFISGDRQSMYGCADHSFTVIAKLWSAYLGVGISPEKVAIMMVLLKAGRSTNTATEDSLIDMAGYAALAWDVSNEILIDDD